MIVRVHNNDDTDYCDYEAETIEEIRELAKNRIHSETWDKGWSERIDE